MGQLAENYTRRSLLGVSPVMIQPLALSKHCSVASCVQNLRAEPEEAGTGERTLLQSAHNDNCTSNFLEYPILSSVCPL